VRKLGTSFFLFSRSTDLIYALMAKFTIRVELHDASPDAYKSLHKSMEAEGFAREIRSGEGKVYHLPTAEYIYDGEANLKGVLDRAKRAASALPLSFEILVTESKGRIWYGLSTGSA